MRSWIWRRKKICHDWHIAHALHSSGIHYHNNIISPIAIDDYLLSPSLCLPNAHHNLLSTQSEWHARDGEKVCVCVCVSRNATTLNDRSVGHQNPTSSIISFTLCILLSFTPLVMLLLLLLLLCSCYCCHLILVRLLSLIRLCSSVFIGHFFLLAASLPCTYDTATFLNANIVVRVVVVAARRLHIQCII